jgi:alkanesulfonate monooxygenase SsuD/methylene tetrahydromethanopterin reductase-like flavin-dependent oxidoreductase (luciferase family)
VLPIWIGGRSEPALKRAGRLADGYHSSATSPAAYAERLPVVRAAADDAGRPMPTLSARVRVEFGAATDTSYAARGTPDEIAAEFRAFAALGVEDVALWFVARSSEQLVEAAERFAAEVSPLV